MINAAVAGGLAAMVAVTLGLGTLPALVIGVVAGVVTMEVLAVLATGVFDVQGRSLETRFPAAGRDQAGRRNT